MKQEGLAYLRFRSSYDTGTYGINVRGLGGDTMHMIRWVDSAMKSYSLEALSRGLLKEQHSEANILDRFGKKEKPKDGTED